MIKDDDEDDMWKRPEGRKMIRVKITRRMRMMVVKEKRLSLSEGGSIQREI